MSKISLVLTGMILGACAQSPGSGFQTALPLGGDTPESACSDVSDCSFSKAQIAYVSFEGMITKRETCSPNKLPAGIRPTDDISQVQARLEEEFSGRAIVSPPSGGLPEAVSIVHSERGNEITVSVSFGSDGQVRCVSEMIAAI